MHIADDTSFSQLIANAGDKPVLVDFHAAWCGPCKAMAPALSAYAAEHPEVVVVKVDVDEAQETALQFRVRSIPTLVVMKQGAVVAQRSGAMSKAQLESFVSSAN